MANNNTTLSEVVAIIGSGIALFGSSLRWYREGDQILTGFEMGIGVIIVLLAAIMTGSMLIDDQRRFQHIIVLISGAYIVGISGIFIAGNPVIFPMVVASRSVPTVPSELIKPGAYITFVGGLVLLLTGSIETVRDLY